MVCSTCGYENQVGNRFCGMCGTPLPHRPLTTPGAQNTASLARPLAETTGPGASSTADGPQARAGLEVVPRPETPASQEPETPLELVPEIPFHDYVQNFRYSPPNDPEERTMRGDASLLRPETPGPSNGSSTPLVETATATTTADALAAVSDEDVRERLGLQAESVPEERSERPRFLDFNQSSPPIKPARAAQSIAGPSFLGLSDEPLVESSSEEEAEEVEPDGPKRGVWRYLLAAAVIVLFGLLGLLEWRSQVRQTNNGPVEVVKTKMRGMGQAKPNDNSSNEAASSASASGPASKPDIQVESPKPVTEHPPPNATTSTQAEDANRAPDATAANTPPANTAPGSTRNQPAAAAPPAQNPSVNAGETRTQPNAIPAAKTTTPTTAVDKSKVAGSQPTAAAAAPKAGKPKPAAGSTDDDEEVVVRKIVPGAEEMARADGASDSAAEAAWLWKATAKGNPTAPVRLADMYVKGDGVPRSCEQALVLLKTAAAKENSMARNQLASMYGAGVCVPRNRVEAYRWVSSALAANPGSEWAQQRRGLLWQQMTPDERILAAKYR